MDRQGVTRLDVVTERMTADPSGNTQEAEVAAVARATVDWKETPEVFFFFHLRGVGGRGRRKRSICRTSGPG